MNKNLLNYIENFLYYSSSEPLQQMVYIIAKLCLISSPVAWVVRRPGNAEDKLFIAHNEALNFLEKEGGKDDYIAPLYTIKKVDMSAGEIRHLLLMPSPHEEE